MSKIKTGIHTRKSSSSIGKNSKRNWVEYEKVGVYQNGFVTTLIIILIFIATLVPQLVVEPKKYEWYFAGLVSVIIITCLNIFWTIGRTGFLSSFRYACYSALTKLRVYELGQKLGDSSYYVRKDIENHHDYHDYCIEKIQYTKKAFLVSWSFNGIVAVTFSLAAMILEF